MRPLNLDWIAGAIDCDGSISIATKQSFIPTVNFRQLEHSLPIVEQIQEILGGKIYIQRGTNLRMVSWQTTTQKECLDVCRLIEPYLRIKYWQAGEVIRAINLWESTKGKPHGRGYEHPQWVKDEIERIAISLNPNNQTSTRRERAALPAPDPSLIFYQT